MRISTKISWELVIAGFFAAVAPIIPLLLIWQSQPFFGAVSDLPEYYASAKMILAGKAAQIYSLPWIRAAQHSWFPAMQDRFVPIFIPPPSLLLLSPLACVPPEVVWFVWSLLLLFSFVVSIFLLRRIFLLSASQTLWIFAVVFLSGPLYESLRLSQLAPVMLVAFCAALWAMRRGNPLLAGVCLAVLFFKPQVLLPYVIFLAGVRRWRMLACLSGVLVFLFLGSFMVFGVEGWQSYLSLLSGSAVNSVYMQPELCPTIRGQLLRFFAHSSLSIITGINIVSLIASIVTYCLIFVIARRIRESDNWLEESLLVSMPLGMISCLHVHEYDLLLLVPSVVAFVRNKMFKRLPVALQLFFICVLPMFMLPIYLNIHYDWLLKGGGVNPLFLLNPFFIVLVIFAVCAAYMSGRRLLNQGKPHTGT